MTPFSLPVEAAAAWSKTMAGQCEELGFQARCVVWSHRVLRRLVRPPLAFPRGPRSA
jgi:hypothetical protein